MNQVNSIVEFTQEQITACIYEKQVYSPDAIRKKFCPHARGTLNSGLLVPPNNVCLGNAFLKTYLDQLCFSQHGCDYWIRRAQVAFNEDQTMSIETFSKRHTLIQNNTIPYVLYKSHPESYSLRFVTLRDWVRYSGKYSVLHLLQYLVELVVFALPMDEFHRENVFRMENPYEYCAARLFQGMIDEKLMHLTQNPISIFVPPHMVQQPGFDAEMNVESTGDDFKVEEFQGHLRDHQIRAMNSTYVSNGTEYLQAISKSKANVFPKHYQDYIGTSSSAHKVGEKMFHNITSGRGANGRGRGAGLGSDFQSSMEVNHARGVIQQLTDRVKSNLLKSLNSSASHTI